MDKTKNKQPSPVPERLTLLNNMSPSPIRRMPIDNHVKYEVSEKSSKTDDTSNSIKQQSSGATSTSMTKTQSKSLTSMTDKHGVIYNTEQRRLSEHEDMKTLLIVSGILAGLGYMYFNN